MACCWHIFLCHQHFIADRAMTSLGLSYSRAGGFYSFILHFLMSCCRDFLLLYQHFITDRAMASLRLSLLRTACNYRLIHNRIVISQICGNGLTPKHFITNSTTNYFIITSMSDTGSCNFIFFNCLPCSML